MTNDETNRRKQGQKSEKVFDLEERTTRLAEDVVGFCMTFPLHHPVLNPLIRQVVRSAGSVAANYAEANDAFSKDEFAYRIGLSRKEARETMLWLRLLGKTRRDDLVKVRAFWREARELNRIFSSIFRKCRPPGKTPAKRPIETVFPTFVSTFVIRH